MLSANIAGLKIKPAVMNASGIFSFLPILKRISEFEIGALVTKSISFDEKIGFDNPIFAQCSKESFINAVGLPNSGCKSLKEELNGFYPMKKPLIVSIFDNSKEKLAKMVSSLDDSCDAFELNLSCPNLMPGEKHGIMIGRDPKLVEEYTRAVRDCTKKPIIVKLSAGPYIDCRDSIKDIAIAAVNAGADAISAINTISGGMKIDIRARKPILAARYGGMSGKSIKPFGIGCVYTIYEALRSNGYDTPIIGMGGIETAEDVIEYVEAGASAVAIGSAFYNKSEDDIKYFLFSLSKNLEVLMKDLDVNKLQDLVGVAHV
ncbi:MAG: dihydroorotate dehydrogenase [Candidatus Aenigmatarchaeota archaeon]